MGAAGGIAARTGGIGVNGNGGRPVPARPLKARATDSTRPVMPSQSFAALVIRDWRACKFQRDDWLVCLACAIAFPLTLIAGSLLATGNPSQFIGAQSMASIWLRFLAPGDFWKRPAFFVTQYPALIPAPIVWLGITGILMALVWHRARGTFLLLAIGALYLIFFETLVWLDYTTLETRFLMYPGLPLIVFVGIALADLRRWLVPVWKRFENIALAGSVVALCAQATSKASWVCVIFTTAKHRCGKWRMSSRRFFRRSNVSTCSRTGGIAIGLGRVFESPS